MARWKVVTAAGTRTDGQTDGRPATGELLFFCQQWRSHGGGTVDVVFGESDLKPFETFLPLNFASCDFTDYGFIFL